MSLLNLLRKHREEVTPRSVNNPKTDALSQNPPHHGQNLPLQSTFHFLHVVAAPNITRIWNRAEGNRFQTVILGRVLWSSQHPYYKKMSLLPLPLSRLCSIILFDLFQTWLLHQGNFYSQRVWFGRLCLEEKNHIQQVTSTDTWYRIQKLILCIIDCPLWSVKTDSEGRIMQTMWEDTKYRWPCPKPGTLQTWPLCISISTQNDVLTELKMKVHVP